MTRAAAPVRVRHGLRAQLRYGLALARRFKVTLALAAVLYLVVPVVFVWLYVGPDGERIGIGAALHHVYFLVFGQTSLPYVPIALLEVLNLVIPPVGIAVVVDGIVRFAYLFVAKHRSDKEWIEVHTNLLKDHVIVCGAGRVGYRVTERLLSLRKEVVVVEKRQDASFVTVLRDLNVTVLIDDIKSPQCLPRLNVGMAAGIVCATDDDLANLNVALDARRANPGIRVVIRLFDDDLVAKVRETFRAEALSSSALAAPAMALAALDPRIIHSFELGGHLMVVSEFKAHHGLPELAVSEVTRRFGGFVLSLVRAEQETLHPPPDARILDGDRVTVQSTYASYLDLRAFTGEQAPPVSWHG